MRAERIYPVRVKPRSQIVDWGGWPDDLRATLREWNRKRALSFRQTPLLSVYKCADCEEFCEPAGAGVAVVNGEWLCDDCVIARARAGWTPVAVAPQEQGDGSATRPGVARRLRWGRSKRSFLLWAGRNFHVFLMSPQLGSNAYGVTVRYRATEGWVHYRVAALQRGAPRSGFRKRHSERGGERFLARPSVILFELSRWNTAGGTSVRQGLKAYFRVKVGLGGRQVVSG